MLYDVLNHALVVYRCSKNHINIQDLEAHNATGIDISGISE